MDPKFAGRVEEQIQTILSMMEEMRTDVRTLILDYERRKERFEIFAWVLKIIPILSVIISAVWWIIINVSMRKGG